MNARLSGWLWTMAVVLAAAGLTGCHNNRTKEERDALWKQNVEAQDKLNQTRAALEAAEADRASLSDESRRLQAELDAAKAAQAARPIATERPVARPTAPPPRDGANRGASIGEGVEVIKSPGRTTVRVPGDVLFDSGKADLRPAARKTLDGVVGLIKSDYAGHKVRVEGYTDTDPIRHSKWKSNQALSEARAAAVEKYLAQKGISAKLMTTVGYGSTKPRGTKAQSRRVEIVVLTGDDRRR